MSSLMLSVQQENAVEAALLVVPHFGLHDRSVPGAHLTCSYLRQALSSWHSHPFPLKPI